MNYLSPKVNSYCEAHTSPEPELLSELNRETYLKRLMPTMLSGHYQGRLLSMIAKMVQPSYVLEIGTFTGYSALCLAEGINVGGKLITIDINEELESTINKFLKKSENTEAIEYICGNALSILPTLDYTFDLVFIDADKENYSNYYSLIIDKVRSGGVIIADNVLWSGKVLEVDHSSDVDTLALAEFNEMVNADDRVENLLLPVRDGLMILIKK